MKSVLFLAVSLLISANLLANRDSNEVNKSKESVLVTSVDAANTTQIKGLVIDNKNQETLAGATIVVGEKKYYSDLDGNFTISGVKPGKCSITVEKISYEPVTLEVDLSEQNPVKVGMRQK